MLGLSKNTRDVGIKIRWLTKYIFAVQYQFPNKAPNLRITENQMRFYHLPTPTSPLFTYILQKVIFFSEVILCSFWGKLEHLVWESVYQSKADEF